MADSMYDNHDLVERLMTLHPPKDKDTGEVMDEVREQYIDLGHLVVRHTPPGPDQTIAIRKLHEALMAAIACIACNQGE